MAKTQWQEILGRVQRALPRNTSFRERGEATRRAAAAYRQGRRPNPSGHPIGFWDKPRLGRAYPRGKRSNPGPNWLLIGAAAAGLWLVFGGKLGGLLGPKGG